MKPLNNEKSESKQKNFIPLTKFSDALEFFK